MKVGDVTGPKLSGPIRRRYMITANRVARQKNCKYVVKIKLSQGTVTLHEGIPTRLNINIKQRQIMTNNGKS